jgi:hypothetical protein
LTVIAPYRCRNHDTAEIQPHIGVQASPRRSLPVLFSSLEPRELRRARYPAQLVCEQDGYRPASLSWRFRHVFYSVGATGTQIARLQSGRLYSCVGGRSLGRSKHICCRNSMYSASATEAKWVLVPCLTNARRKYAASCQRACWPGLSADAGGFVTRRGRPGSLKVPALRCGHIGRNQSLLQVTPQRRLAKYKEYSQALRTAVLGRLSDKQCENLLRIMQEALHINDINV